MGKGVTKRPFSVPPFYFSTMRLDFLFKDDYTVISWYPRGTDSRTHTGTKVCRCASPTVRPPYPHPQTQPTTDRVQLTFEQHGFELYGSTYTWIFFPINLCISKPVQY